MDGRRDGSWAASVGVAVARIRQAQGDSRDLLDALVVSASALLDAPAGVALVEHGQLILRAATGEASARLGSLVETDGTLCGHAMVTGRPVLCDDTLVAPVGSPDGRCCPGARSVLCVPLLSGRQPMGVVHVVCDQPEWFDDVDSSALVVLAAAAADALAGQPLPPVVGNPPPGPSRAAPPTVPPAVVEPSAVPGTDAGGSVGSGHAGGYGHSGGAAGEPGPAEGEGPADVGDRGGGQYPVVAPATAGGSPQRVPGPQTGQLPIQPRSPQPRSPQLRTSRTHPAGPRAVGAASGTVIPQPGASPPSGSPPLGAGADLTGPADLTGVLDVTAVLDLAAVAGLAALADVAPIPEAVSPLRAPAGPVSGSAVSAGAPPHVVPWRLGLWQWDAATATVTCSPEVAELVGLAGGESPGLAAIRELLHPQDVARFDEMVMRQAAGATRVEGTFRVITEDGGVRRLHARSELRAGPDGRVIGGHGVLIDVTQHDVESAALRSRLLGLHAAQQLTGVGLWEWHPSTNELIWSTQMYELVGLTPGQVQPTLAHWHHFVHAEDLDRARRLDVQAVERDDALTETFRVVGADGVLRHVQSWSLACPGRTGTVVCGATVDVTRQVRDRMLIERLSATDAVTGLGNRFAFDRRIRQMLDDPSRDVALLLLDLDRFKSVNDSLGHQIGDRLLVEVSRRLAGLVPTGSVTARMGGDEFVVVPRPGIGWLQVRELAQSIVETLRMPYVLPDGGEMLVCPVSVGVTSTSGREVSAHELLSEADLALYEAKDSGRDRYVVFDDALRARARTRHLAERSLRSALEQGRLNLQYQPIVDLHTGWVVGSEALVRIVDGDTGRMLPPEEFIDVAEDTGLVVEIDCWVIDNALEQVARWTERHRSQHRGTRAGPPWLAINVSARSMEHPRVVNRLLDGMKQRRLPAGLIKVELTERSFLGTLPGGESSLRHLIDSGVPVGIDDFGTGYSALAYLQRFDLDFMKIDRSFVSSLGDEERADAVVTAIVDLAHAHDMQVTAEGIENPRQARRLREIGCDFAQGYHFGRPGDAARILAG